MSIEHSYIKELSGKIGQSVHLKGWVSNKREGKGVMKFQDGRQFKGDWLNDKMHGFGEFTWPDGKSY